jgi:polysaccharide biosynthesis transport protein
MDEPEAQSQQPPGLRDYLRVIRERWWIIVLAVVVVVGAMLASSYTATSLYRASSKLVYQTNTLDKTLFGAQLYSDANQSVDVQTSAELVKTPPIADAVKKQLGSPLSSGQLLGMLSVASSTTTKIIQIDAVSTDPKQASDVANAFAQQFIIFRQNTDRATVAAAGELVKQQLDGLSSADASSAYGLMLKEKYESLQILGAMQTGGFSLAESAVAPSRPFSPRPKFNAEIGLAIGLVLGLGLAFLLNYFDKRIKDTKGLERSFSLPVLVSVPAVGGSWKNGDGGARSSGPVGFATHPSLLESFRVLRSSLQYFDVGKGIRTILVTSGLPQEGKTVTSINLALSMALAGERVVIVEADLRHPMVGRYLGVNDTVGLSSVLAGRATFAEAVRRVDIGPLVPQEVRDEGAKETGVSLERSLFYLPSGPIPPNPAELLSSAPMDKLLQELRLNKHVDCVIIDAPPLLSVADALVIAPQVDAVVVTSKMNSTTHDEAEEVADLLRRSGARVIGVVAGGVKARSSYYQRRGYQQHSYR